MANFYSSLTQGDQPKWQALRDAALSLLQSKQYSHLYYWAPFVLMGDWRKLDNE